MKKSSFIRVDERLIHGQVVHGWLRYLKVKAIVVVDREVALDKLRQQIYQCAVPRHITVHFVRPEECGGLLDEGEATLFLFKSIDQMAAAIAAHEVETINVGCVQKTASRTHSFDAISISDAELAQLTNMKNAGMVITFQQVPGGKKFTL
ncbi:PTS sugar transporter subunit IIB [Chrysiogenes arsenatis]|uniref:PTS sugar transporter subunit IIB n=1 Tax=Chrysiogenes arsenatis TaxID=309797 RepID=UPI000688A5FD|nr:PTS sugar transporter subunit IIB [Chrysiogenes arsenatis]